MTEPGSVSRGHSLRRDLGTLHSYAALLGMLIGAGIFSVTREAWVVSGPSVLVGHLVLAPAILASSVPYAVFLSTPLGRAPGGEYSHILAVLRWPAIAFLGAWLKIISYVGALAYLADVLGEHLAKLGGWNEGELLRHALGLGSLAFFTAVHAVGVRWFGRLQVVMCAVLGVSVFVLVIPGLASVDAENLRPVFPTGFEGFASSLPLLFFAYAGFESLAQTAGEVKDSRHRLPRVFVKGIAATTLVYLALTLVIVGAVPPDVLLATETPATAAAEAVLPASLVWVVTLGVVMAVATSVNATVLVPSRLALVLARDGRLPRVFGAVHASAGTPIVGLCATFAGAAALLLSGQMGLALQIAVFALVLLYFLHSLAFVLLPSRDADLFASADVKLPRWLYFGSGLVSLVTLGFLLGVQVVADVTTIASDSFGVRVAETGPTTIELIGAWAVAGLVIYRLVSRRAR